MLGEQENMLSLFIVPRTACRKGNADKEKVGVGNIGICKSDIEDFCDSSRSQEEKKINSESSRTENSDYC